MRVSRIRSIAAAGAITAGAITGVTAFTAAPAHAMPISTVSSECHDAGGSFYRDTYGSTWYGYVCAISSGGTVYKDFYDKHGNWEYGCEYRGGKPVACDA
jgi:hypothetical protein